MHWPRLTTLLILLGLALGLSAIQPLAALAAGTTVSSFNPGGTVRDLWPDIAEAPDGSRLTAAWITDYDTKKIDRDVRVATSTDGGASWSSELIIFEGKVGTYLDPARLAYDSQGNLHLVFMYGLGASRQVRSFLLPAGADPAVAGHWQEGGALCSNCTTPDLAVDRDGGVYVIYESPDNYLGIRHRVGIGGWGPERRVSIGQRIKGTLAVSPDRRLHIALYDVSRDLALYARYPSYEDFNQETLAQVSTGPMQSATAIAADPNGHVHIVWKQQDRFFYREYAGGGLSDPVAISPPQAGSNNFENVAIEADAGGNVFVSWVVNLPGATSAGLFENQRRDGQWQTATQLAGSAAARARYPHYGSSLRGTVNLAFVEGNITRFLSRTGSQPQPAPTPQVPTDRRPDPGATSPNWDYFLETGHFLAAGFKAFWVHNGGLPIFGFPLTTEFSETNADTGASYTVQYVERQRFEYHPELQGTPYETLLGRLGADEARQRGLLDSPAFQPVAPGSEGDCAFFPETGHRVCAGFRDYWQNYGLEFGDPGVSTRESVALFGYPISEEFVDPATGLTVQYFERARFEYHPANPDAHRVLLTRLGAALLLQRGWLR